MIKVNEVEIEIKHFPDGSQLLNNCDVDLFKDNSEDYKILWRYESDDMVQAINCAMEVYKDQKTWKCIQKSAMNYDYSWDKSAKKYLEVYKSLV